MNSDNQQNQNPNIQSFAERYGLHPLVAGGMFALDHMLFYTLEVPTMGLLAVISAFLGVAAILPCALIQRHCYQDSLGAAWGKAMLTGLLLSVPSPLPSYFFGTFGVVGLVAMARRARMHNTRPYDHDDPRSDD